MTPKCPDCKHDQDDCSCSETIESLRQQLADHIKREVMLRERAQRLIENADWKVGGMLSDESPTRDIPSRAGSWVKTRNLASLRDALTATADLDSLILCHAEPVRYIYEFKDYEGRTIWSSNLEHNGQVPTATIPLYRAWEPK